MALLFVCFADAAGRESSCPEFLENVIGMGSTVTVYHNADCSKSRAALAYLAEHAPDREVIVVNYLDTPPSKSKLAELIRRGGMGAHDLIHTGKAWYRKLALDETMSDNDLYAAMAQHPILIAVDRKSVV